MNYFNPSYFLVKKLKFSLFGYHARFRQTAQMETPKLGERSDTCAITVRESFRSVIRRINLEKLGMPLVLINIIIEYANDLSGNCARVLKSHKKSVTCVAVLRDKCLGQVLATGSDDGTVRIWREGICVSVYAHNRPVLCLVALSNGLLASGSTDCTIKLWSHPDADCLILMGHSGPVSCLAILRDGRLASGSSDTNICTWDPETGCHVNTLTGHTSRVHFLAEAGACELGPILVSGSHDKTFRVWANGVAVRTITFATCFPAVAIGEDIALSFEGRLRIYNMLSGTYYDLAEHNTPIRQLCPMSIRKLCAMPNRNVIAICSGRVCMLDLNGVIEQILYVDATDATWLPSGHLAVTCTDGTVRLCC
jgi:WD40 repeat protein